MTIALNTPSFDHYTGTGTVKLYPVTFPTYEDSTVKCFVSKVADWDHITVDGNLVIELVEDVDFNYLNINRPNTAVSLLDASAVPPGWSGPIPDRQEWIDINGNLATGYFLFIEFISNAMRPSTLAHGNALVPALSKDLDRLAMHIKALNHKLIKSYEVLREIIRENGSLPSGFEGDYLEYNAAGELEAKTGHFSGFSGTLNRQVNVTSLTAAIEALFDWQTFDPTIILVFLGVGAGPFEKGVPVAVNNIQATVSQGTAEMSTVNIAQVTGPGAADIPDGPWVFNAPADFNPTGTDVVATTEGPWNITDTVTVTATVTDEDNKTGNASRTVNFVYPKFYGKTVETATEAQIKALAKFLDGVRGRAGVNAPAGINFIYYAYPAALGDLTSITHSAAPTTNTLAGNWFKTVVNFTMADGAAVPYNIYCTNTVSTTTTGTFTFS